MMQQFHTQQGLKGDNPTPILHPEFHKWSRGGYRPNALKTSGDIEITSEDTLCVTFIGTRLVMGTGTITDSSGASWTKKWSNDYIAIYTTSDLLNTGVRTITHDFDTPNNTEMIVHTVKNSKSYFSNTISSSREVSSKTISSDVVPISDNVLIMSYYAADADGNLDLDINDFKPTSRGSGQVFEASVATEGVVNENGAPPDRYIEITSELATSTALNTQSFTAPLTADAKTIACLQVDVI